MSESSIWSPGAIPGPPGPPGPAGTIAVGTVSTTAAGTQATIINVGSPAAAILNFTLPKGDTGAGVAGPAGPPGPSTQGPIGPAGPAGAASVIYQGVGPPSAGLGTSIDYYIDASNAYFYGPKGASWPVTFIDLRAGASGVNYGNRSITNSVTAIPKLAAADATLVSNTDYTQIINVWDTIPSGINRGVSQQTNSITIDRDGAYQIEMWASLSSSVANNTVAFKFAVNGAISLVRRPRVRLDVSGNIYGLAAHGQVQLLDGDIITLWMACTVAGNITISDLVLTVQELR